MRRFVLVAFLAAAPGFVLDAAANGRPPAASTIHFRQGHETDIVVGLTFGLVVSHDGGTSWQWMCEKAVGYGGMYDPDYAYTPTGAIFATTFDGLKVSRDGCTFAATPPGMTFVSQVEVGPDHAVYYAAADSNAPDSKIYKSTDDGVTFPQSASPGMAGDWWQTLIVAPSDANRVYLSGYRFVRVCNPMSPTPYMTCTTDPMCMDTGHPNGKCEGMKQWLLFKSANGGSSFTPLPGNLLFSGNTTTVGLTTSTTSGIDFLGVDHANPNILYARVTLENGTTVGDGLYKIDTSTGTTWTPILKKADGLFFIARQNGDLVAATQTLGAFKSTNQGASWTDLASAPHINCLAENAAGEVWVCTQNYGNPPNVPSDGYGLMKSTDLATWTGVLRFQDITGPVTCAAGTAQQDMCVGDPISGVWCGLRQQLGITANPVSCAVAEGAPADDSAATKKPAGCCDSASGGGAAAGVLGGVVAGMLLLRRRRPKLGQIS
jgi:hypothetical protein